MQNTNNIVSILASSAARDYAQAVTRAIDDEGRARAERALGVTMQVVSEFPSFIQAWAGTSMEGYTILEHSDEMCPGVVYRLSMISYRTDVDSWISAIQVGQFDPVMRCFIGRGENKVMDVFDHQHLFQAVTAFNSYKEFGTVI